MEHLFKDHPAAWFLAVSALTVCVGQIVGLWRAVRWFFNDRIASISSRVDELYGCLDELKERVVKVEDRSEALVPLISELSESLKTHASAVVELRVAIAGQESAFRAQGQQLTELRAMMKKTAGFVVE